MTFQSELEKLAANVAKRAGEEKTPFTETIDALKALTALFGIISKKGKAEPDDEPGSFTMADAQNMIEGPGNGSSEPAAVRGR